MGYLKRSSVVFFSSRRRHTRYIGDWSSDVCSSDLRDRRPEVAPQPAEQVGEVGGLESFRERRHQRCRQTAHAHYIFAQQHLLDAAGLYEIGRASCRERVESSGVAVTVKNKERKWYV